MFCVNCGTKLADGARFCQGCGKPIETLVQPQAPQQQTILLRARVTMVQHGYGDLILTEQVLSWNKAGTTYVMFGVLGALTDDHVSVALSDIISVETYTYIGSGGIKILDKAGRELKISFKTKKDFQEFYDRLKVYAK